MPVGCDVDRALVADLARNRNLCGRWPPPPHGILDGDSPTRKTKGRGLSDAPAVESPLGPYSMKTDAQHSQDSKRKAESNLLGGEILQGRDC